MICPELFIKDKCNGKDSSDIFREMPSEVFTGFLNNQLTFSFCSSEIFVDKTVWKELIPERVEQKVYKLIDRIHQKYFLPAISWETLKVVESPEIS